MISEKSSRKYGLVDAVVFAIWLGLFAFVYIGFFYPAPFDTSRYSILRYLRWSAWVGLPILACLVLLLYVAVRTGRLRRAAAMCLVGSLLVALFAGYFVVTHLYLKPALRAKLKEYHPYLHSCPPAYEPRPATTSPVRSLKVFCLGGSTTEWTDSAGRGWPGYLEEQLQAAAAGRPVECHNFGKAFYTTLNSLVNYECNLRQHRPDVVIVMHAVNDMFLNADFSRLCLGDFHEDYRHFLGPISRIIKQQSAFQNIREMMRLIWYYKPRQVVNPGTYPGLASFERYLRTIIDLARLDGTTVVLMTQPSIYKDEMTAEEIASLDLLHFWPANMEQEWSTGAVTRGMEQYNELTRRLASEQEGVCLIDLERAVPKNLEHFRDDVHYQDKTFHLIAGFVAKELERLDVLRPTAE